FIEPYSPIGEYGPSPAAAAAAVQGRDLAVKDRRAVAGDAAGVRRLTHCAQPFPAVAWRGRFEALLEGLSAEAVKRGEVDMTALRRPMGMGSLLHPCVCA